MKLVTVLVSICAVGYLVDHWKELAPGHHADSADNPRVIIYGGRSEGSCVKLDSELRDNNIPHRLLDISNDANYHEMAAKLARIGKMNGNIPLPVVDVDGVILEGATFPQIAKRLRTDGNGH